MRTNLNSSATLKLDRKLIRQKGFLNRIYRDFYYEFKKTKLPRGKIIELGSGAGFIKDIIPEVITSDVIPGPDIDEVFLAEKIPFAKKSVAAFFMIDVLHHIKNPEKAFREMEKCLARGGKIKMIEPYNSFLGSLIYKYLHYEHFDPEAEWKIKGRGRMSDSNTALPWIIFVRDRKKFKRMFPNLKIVKIKPHTIFKYLLSGGLSKPQLLPTSSYGFIQKIEDFLSPLFPYLGMFATIELEKTT